MLACSLKLIFRSEILLKKFTLIYFWIMQRRMVNQQPFSHDFVSLNKIIIYDLLRHKEVLNCYITFCFVESTKCTRTCNRTNPACPSKVSKGVTITLNGVVHCHLWKVFERATREKSCYVASEFIALSLLVGIC
jgi:hypothetical protein